MFLVLMRVRILELEVDEGLDLGGFYLDDNPDECSDEEGLKNEGKASDEAKGIAVPGLGKEVERKAYTHQESNTGIGREPL